MRIGPACIILGVFLVVRIPSGLAATPLAPAPQEAVDPPEPGDSSPRATTRDPVTGQGAFPGAAPSAPVAPPDSIRALRMAMGSVQRLNRSPVPSAAVVVEQLDLHARTIPGDDWITGHRVGLRVALDDLDAALDVAESCVASAWWCAALLGFVRHVRGEYVEAEIAFDRALARMPEDVRCAWLGELRHVLAGDLARRHRDADCLERADIARHVWWLADPLYLRPGNDRRTEHLSRLVTMELHHQWIGDHGYCPPEHHHPVIADGWSPWWGELYTTMGGAQSQGGYGFIPASQEWVPPVATGATDWDLRPRGGGERFKPPYGEFRAPPTHQTMYFDRGDSAIVVSAVDVAAHPLAVAPDARVGMFLTSGPDAPPVMIRIDDPVGIVRFRASVQSGAQVASLELVTAANGAARSRFGIGATEAVGPWMSDLLLFEWDGSASDDLDEVARRMLPGNRVPRNAHVGVYWEVYGATDDEVSEIAILVTPLQGFFGRLASALRLTSRDEVRTSWVESVGEGDAKFGSKSLGIELAGLPPGRYRVQLAMQLGSGQELVKYRDIQITD